MRLLLTEINPALLLDECYFYDCSYNIDHLVTQACIEYDNTKQLVLLSCAAKECDKFHSYFHFEESFFYFTLGVHSERLKMYDEAIEAYRNAVALYPLNKCAYAALINLYERFSLTQDVKTLVTDMKSRGIILRTEDKCNRPFSKFEDYVAFATHSQISEQWLAPKVAANNFWLSFAEFEACGDINLLKETITRVKCCHVNYHNNAALIYYNYSMIYEQLGDIALANSMMIKSKNLNPERQV